MCRHTGPDDPRIGTHSSIFDEDFSKRNLLWLASTNTVYQLRGATQNFPVEALCGLGGVSHFYTVSTTAFGPNPFDINYYHREGGPTEDACQRAPDASGCTISVFGGFRPGLQTTAQTPTLFHPPPVADCVLAKRFPKLAEADITRAIQMVGGNQYRAEQLLKGTSAVAEASAHMARIILLLLLTHRPQTCSNVPRCQATATATSATCCSVMLDTLLHRRPLEEW